jgi:MoaA/NifB/PqqE/SkfB family radical SAM enzyme
MPLRWTPWLHPRLDWIQVEVSSHCPAACLYCPHTLYRQVWQQRHMSLDDFRRLSAAFAKTGMLYLQGWGEPLSHPELFEMVRLAKAAGCRVGLTTNGMLLDEEKCLRLVQGGVDIVALSLAGVDEKNDIIRQGTRFHQVVDAIQTLSRMKKLLGSVRPDVHLAYLMLRSRREEVEGLPVLLQRLNVKQAVISTLDFLGDRALAGEAILPDTED